MKILNNISQAWWHEQQFLGVLLQLANIFQNGKYYHCSHGTMQNIDC